MEKERAFFLFGSGLWIDGFMHDVETAKEMLCRAGTAFERTLLRTGSVKCGPVRDVLCFKLHWWNW